MTGGKNMQLELKRVGVEKAEALWKMQVEAFQELYEKYQDTETSPATESIDKTVMRLNQSFTYFYFIEMDGTTVGAIRVIDKQEVGKAKRISPIFVMPEYRNRGLAQKAIQLVEEILSCFERHWHNGYAIEAATACRKYAFEVLGADEVCSIIRDTNMASQKVAIRNHMKKEDTWTKYYRGVNMPHYRYVVHRR